MKKISGILTVSLVAIMVVGAARADLASTTFVDKAVAGKEDKSNKVTAISSTSSDTQYPSAKAVYTELAKKQNKLTIDTALSADSTNPVQNKVINTALGTKQNKLTAGDNITIDANNKISATGLASSGELTKLTTRVTTAEGDIVNLKAKDDELDTKIGSVPEGMSLAEVVERQNNTLTTWINGAKSTAETAKATADAALPKTEFNTFKTANDTALAGKQDKLVTSGTNANFVAGNNVTITQDATTGKITVSSKNTTYGTGNTSTAGLTKLYTTTGTNTDGTMTQNAIKTALDGKEATANKTNTYDAAATDKATKFPTVNAAEAIATAKVNAAAGNYATATQGTKADNALPKKTYDDQVGTVSAATMGTAASTVVTAIKEVADRTTQVKSMADTAGQAAEAAQATADSANTAIAAMDLAAQTGSGVIKTVAQTDGKVTVTRGTIVNAEIASNAAIAQSKIAGLTDALAGKQAKGNYITVPAADGTDGTKVLTAKTENGATTYYWENIGR